MIALLILIAVIANTVLLSLIYLALRDALHTREAQKSVRRQWAKVEKTP